MVEPKLGSLLSPMFPRGEPPRGRLDSRLVLGDDEAAVAVPTRELRVCRRVVAAATPRAPQGHMFIVPTSWKRAGKRP
jgi:hypothetical protein